MEVAAKGPFAAPGQPTRRLTAAALPEDKGIHVKSEVIT